MLKTFKGDFDNLLQRLKNNKYFANAKFSDGELFIMMNRSLKLDETGTYIDNILVHSAYPNNDHKEFDPDKHQFLKEKLIEAFTDKIDDYFVGISCPCCIGISQYKWMKKLRNDDKFENTVFANCFVNSNFPKFISEFLPELKKRKIVFICNEKADFSNTELNVIKHFPVKKNGMIEQFNLWKEIDTWINENNIKDHIFLFAASSLSKITIHELWKKHKDSFFIDVGSALDKEIKLGTNRDYIRAFYNNQYHPDLFKSCVLL